jgi:hypothetical protein
MAVLTPEARSVLESGALVHLVTLNQDGSPQMSCVWVGVEGDEVVSGHMIHRLKLRNVERDPRVVLRSRRTATTSSGCASTWSSTAGGASRRVEPRTCCSAWHTST